MPIAFSTQVVGGELHTSTMSRKSCQIAIHERVRNHARPKPFEDHVEAHQTPGPMNNTSRNCYNVHVDYKNETDQVVDRGRSKNEAKSSDIACTRSFANVPDSKTHFISET